jgi:hypothetical protein
VPQEVVDAHINGCHQDCTWAQVRRLLAEGRHFQSAVFGTNQFQLCEHAHSKRVLHQRMLVPVRDVGALLVRYGRAAEPMTYAARFFGGALLESYADTAVLQRRWANAAFGAPRAQAAHRWVRPTSPPRGEPLLCAYGPGDVDYKQGFSAALLDDLGRLSDVVYLLLLPDESLELNEPRVHIAWAKHRALHRALVAGRAQVALVDLATGEGARARSHFRDGVHVNSEGARLQRALFQRLIAAQRAKRRR